eukprot:TRINITY_DN3215_c0_g2_i1.p1 TRINITY_DN3215_c0_g2~~TRINITY_DN3215_c0_g2_i1.p1  ORF type:complete len:371 (+),score=78.75 TRINITY_DN3215_c0_g2_i1:60-1115(+)
MCIRDRSTWGEQVKRLDNEYRKSTPNQSIMNNFANNPSLAGPGQPGFGSRVPGSSGGNYLAPSYQPAGTRAFQASNIPFDKSQVVPPQRPQYRSGVENESLLAEERQTVEVLVDEARLHQVFNKIKDDNTEFISKKEVENLLDHGQNVNAPFNTFIRQKVKMSTIDNFDFPKFKELFTFNFKSETDLRLLFQLIDSSGNGSIEVDELKEIFDFYAKNDDEKLSDKDIENIKLHLPRKVESRFELDDFLRIFGLKRTLGRSMLRQGAGAGGPSGNTLQPGYQAYLNSGVNATSQVNTVRAPNAFTNAPPANFGGAETQKIPQPIDHSPIMQTRKPVGFRQSFITLCNHQQLY